MEIKEIQSKEAWEQFLLQCQDKTFLHSWNWGEFQRAMRERVWRFGVYESDILVSVALVVKVAAKRGTFLLVPHGPAVAPSEGEGAKAGGPILKQQILQTLLEKLKKIAKEENASFIRINPIWQRTQGHIKLFKDLGFRNAPIQMHPEASWKLDIRPSEDKLFKNMRKTTRYLIHQAQKNPDIAVFQSATPQDLRRFSELHNTVSARQHFVPFSFEYLQNECALFQKDNAITIFWGTYKGEIAASAFLIFWSGIGFYHHAVSLKKYAKLSLPYLLQWEAIKEAKRRGCLLYDFWGYVNPQTQPSHPWAGPTLFKMGFGGVPHEYVKTQDFPLSWKYKITMIFEQLRKIRRNI